MIVVGLTGSIGMGKSTALAAFAALGVPVWSADEAVHRLYAAGDAGARAVARLAPAAVGPDGVDRETLRAAILSDPLLLRRIEAAVHPLVAADRNAFLDRARAAGASVAVCEIPLLFETGPHDWIDRIVVVSAPADAQRARVLERPGMTAEAFEAMLARQVPDSEKRALADFVVDTGGSSDAARDRIADILTALTAPGEGD